MRRSNSVDDHIHLLYCQSKNHALATTIKEIKRRSTLFLRGEIQGCAGFHWQKGYGAFSVSASNLANVKSYIENQKEHHKTQSFQDEMRAWLKKYGLDFDERYLWE